MFIVQTILNCCFDATIKFGNLLDKKHALLLTPQ